MRARTPQLTRRSGDRRSRITNASSSRPKSPGESSRHSVPITPYMRAMRGRSPGGRRVWNIETSLSGQLSSWNAPSAAFNAKNARKKIDNPHWVGVITAARSRSADEIDRRERSSFNPGPPSRLDAAGRASPHRGAVGRTRIPRRGTGALPEDLAAGAPPLGETREASGVDPVDVD